MTHECQDCGRDTPDLMHCDECDRRFCENCFSEKHMICNACRDKLRTCDQPDDMQWFHELPASFLYWLSKPNDDPVAIAECEIDGKTYSVSASTIADAIHNLRADCGEVGEK
jgi:hypothetical protein